MRIALLLVAAALAAAGESPVRSVADDGRITVELAGIPVAVELALVEWPEGGEARRAAVARLRELLGSAGELGHEPDYGVAATGVGRVSLAAKGRDVAVALVEAGLVRAAAGQGTHARRLALAQDKAKAARAGVWAFGAQTASAQSSGQAARPATPAASGSEVVSELGSSYYYPAGHRAVASVNPQRLTRYATAAAAEKAGKRAPPPETELPKGEDRATADAIFEQGRALMKQAMSMGPSAERDRLYAQAFPILGRAVQIYDKLSDANPKDGALAEQLRVANQMRHAAMKYRRA